MLVPNSARKFSYYKKYIERVDKKNKESIDYI